MLKDPLHANFALTLDKLRKGAAFRVTAVHCVPDGCLVTEAVYRITSTMTDSGRAVVVEQIAGPIPTRKNHARIRPEIKISREQARGIAVYMLRQP